MTREIFKKGNLTVEPAAGPAQADGAAVPPGPKVELVGRTKTAPGGMANFLVQRSEVHREADQLRERLKDFDGAVPSRHLDPAQIRPSEWANRHESAFLTAAFAAFRDEIGLAGGNVQPIKIRKIRPASKGVSPGNTPDGTFLYEVVYGHRRHRACMELGIPVLAMIESELDDQALFLEMYRENIGREDLTPWEQGMMHAQALSKGLFSSIRQLAKAVGQEPGTISKALTLTQLPKQVVEAFSSPLILQYRWVAPLNVAIQGDPDSVLARAAELRNEQEERRKNGQGSLEPAQVLARLLGSEGEPAATPVAVPIEVGGRRVAKLKVDKAGRPTIDFKDTMSSVRRAELVEVVRKFLSAG